MLKFASTTQLRHIFIVSIYILALGYFAWQATLGNKGLIAYIKKQNILVSKRTELMNLDLEHADLEHRILLLQPDALDRDLVDELSRQKLGLADPKDKILLQPKYDRSISK